MQNRKLKLTVKEHSQALDALIDWFRSQDIEPPDAIPILTQALFSAIVIVSDDKVDFKLGMETVRKGMARWEAKANNFSRLWAAKERRNGQV